MKRSYIREILDSINEETISFAGGLPNEELFPLSQIQESTSSVLKSSKALQYSSSQGDNELREQIASLYTDKMDFPTNKDEILITTGSQQSFDIISKIFIQNEILVQNPSYIGALSAFKMLGINVKGYKSISYLNLELNQKNALYCMSDFANPNTSIYSQEERTEVVHILRKKKSFIIEDGAYSLLSFDGEIQKPISAHYKKSFHLGSFSKIIAPGLRVGWIRAEKELIKKMLISKEALDLHTPTLNQMIISNYLKNNNLFGHLNKVRADYEERMRFMCECFDKYIPSFKYIQPKGGMFIYGSFKEDSFALAQKALEKNIAFVPAKVFFYDERDSTEARFNFTNASKEKIEEGIKGVASLLKLTEYNESIWFTLFKQRLSSF